MVDVSRTAHVSLQGLTVADGRGVGVRAEAVMGLDVSGVEVRSQGQRGIDLHNASDSVVRGCSVRNTGCAAIRAHGGFAPSLMRGNLHVENNTVRRFGRWKRTYEAGIHWAGVGNTYRNNDIADGPHNGMLGGGNEADADSTVAGVDCIFEGNVIDSCSFEAADTGAFYVCGQMASAFVNRNNSIVNNRFSRIRNTVGTGVQTASVQAIYLDDQMSGWTIENNSFVDCQVGSFIGGGRDNTVVGNYYERCDTAQHFDNRGMNWQKTACACDGTCEPLSAGCGCNAAAASWMLHNSSAAGTWAARFPEMATVSTDRQCEPAHNTISHNTYCKCGRFLDAKAADVAAWGSTATNNVEVTTC